MSSPRISQQQSFPVPCHYRDLKKIEPKNSFPMTYPEGSKYNIVQRAKKAVSDSPGLVDFAIGLVNSALNLPNGQVKYFEEFNLQKNCEINSAHQKNLWG